MIQQLRSLVFIFMQMSEKVVHEKTCIWMVIASLSVIAKTWEQPRYPSIEWIYYCTYIQRNIIQY